MNAKQLFDAGQVTEAIKALSAHLRDHPNDIKQRTFLFELLCFAGEYERAEKHLHLLAKGGNQAEIGAVLYFSALHAERTRQEMFRSQSFPQSTAPIEGFQGTFNGKPFTAIRDADPDVGGRLEIYAAGSYMWLPFRHIASLQVEPPKRLRDTLWAPAFVVTGPSFQGTELGEVIIPVIYPFSYKHPDESVWLGRSTAWGEDDQGVQYPSGQKMFLIDGEEVPLLEVRSIEFQHGEAATS
jgi:type VI secretion system protein ImpE